MKKPGTKKKTTPKRAPIGATKKFVKQARSLQKRWSKTKGKAAKKQVKTLEKLTRKTEKNVKKEKKSGR